MIGAGRARPAAGRGAVFNTAYDDWANDSTADLRALMQRSLADLCQAVGVPYGHAGTG
jgi:hypothetical protein